MHQSPELSHVALDVVSPGLSPRKREVEFCRARASRGRVALSMARRHSGKHATPSPFHRINVAKTQSP
jgi:hypothetical protein